MSRFFFPRLIAPFLCLTLCLAASLPCALWTSSAHAQAIQPVEQPVFYFSALPDMPIAPGLTEDANSAVHFDQPEGRVIILQASGKASAEDTESFYNNTLPALGWKKLTAHDWQRDGETLDIAIQPLRNQKGQSGARVQITVQPE